MSEILFHLDRINLGYGRRTVLENVSMTIHEGEFWVLLGPNGHGKSTLLHAMVGILRPLSGEVLSFSDTAERVHLGFVPQSLDIAATLPLTVREFVSLGLVGLPRTTAEERRAKVAAALDKVGLGQLQRHSFWELSGGQRQRTIVARALIREPRVMLVDEPTNNLDAASEASLLALMRTLNRNERVTVVFVGHSLEVARRHASHVALVHDGQVHAGASQKLLRREYLVRAFGADALENFRTVEGGPLEREP